MSWDVFLPPETNMAKGKSKISVNVSLIVRFSIAMFVFGGAVDNMEPALKNCYRKGALEGGSGLRGC